jgi:hypothetical protein
MYKRLHRQVFILIVVALAQSAALAQKSKINTASPSDKAVLWQQVDVSREDFYGGPGGEAMKPDLSTITFIKRETGGHNKKFRIKDGSGRVWIAKPGTEARPETAAVRILNGLGYETEINYLVPELTIPSAGTFKNVRLEARPDNVERLDPWSWKNNPFVGSNELQGLKIMQVFMTNYDLLDLQNQTLAVNTPNGRELHYIISDLGSTFGKFGSNNLPIFFRFGRKADSPSAWNKAKFIKGVKDGKIVFATTGAKSRKLFKDITVAQGRWLYDLLTQIRDEQWHDAFRAANYSPAEVDLLTAAAKRRVTELERAVGERVAVQKE